MPEEEDARGRAIRMRPRHVLCAIGFEPRPGLAELGHGIAMVTNMARIVADQLRACDGEDTRVIVVDSADSFCAPCRLRDGRACRSDGRAERIDAAHAAALGFAPGEVLRWGDMLDRVRRRIVPDDLDRLCEGCPWLPVGMCKAGVARLASRGRPDVATPAV